LTRIEKIFKIKQTFLLLFLFNSFGLSASKAINKKGGRSREYFLGADLPLFNAEQCLGGHIPFKRKISY
jgi:Na+/glutamate symporter